MSRPAATKHAKWPRQCSRRIAHRDTDSPLADIESHDPHRDSILGPVRRMRPVSRVGVMRHIAC